MPSPNLALVLAAVLGRVSAGSVPLGQPCDPAATRLDPASFTLESDCAFNAFCAQDRTCAPKQCRRDEYAFGYASHNASLPPLCPAGFFCADEEDKCRPLLPPGALCQMNRDDECAPPPSAHPDAGSLCLNFTCTPATARLGDACVIDTLHHVWRAADGSAFGVTVARDDCLRVRDAAATYCDPATRVCVRRKPLGVACGGDWECLSDTCSPDSDSEAATAACVEPPETPYRVTPLQYALAGTAIVAGMLSVCGILIALNRRHRAQRRVAVQEYYREQTAYRNAINALIAAVATEGAGAGTHLDQYQYQDDDDDEHCDGEAMDDGQPLLHSNLKAGPCTWKFGSGLE